MLGFVRLLLFLSTVLFVGVRAQAAWIDVQLRTLKSNPTQKTRVLILLKQGGETAPSKFDRSAVLKFLNSKHRTSFIQDFLKTQARIVRYHWINHSITAEVDLAALKEISQLPSVHKIYQEPTVELDEPTITSIEKPEAYHFDLTRLSQLVHERPDIDGHGVRIGVIDSGVQGDHPSLTGRIARFYNPITGLEESPQDFGNGHGTHVSGILVGERTGNNPIGFAPGAKIEMVAGTRGADQSLILRSLEYLLDPDGNPDTADGPRVINNSWGIRTSVDVEPFYRALDTLEYAGVNVVFSAGNTGHVKQGLTAPKEHPSTITVGAVNSQSKRYVRSSLGPAIFKGRTLNKPELVAPGVDIFSSDKRALYRARTGTSMAAPQVAATIAMMLQVAPDLTPDHVRGLLLSNLTRLSQDLSQDWDAGLGYGLLNTYEAVAGASAYNEIQLRLVPAFLASNLDGLFAREYTPIIEANPFAPANVNFPPKGFVSAADF